MSNLAQTAMLELNSYTSLLHRANAAQFVAHVVCMLVAGRGLELCRGRPLGGLERSEHLEIICANHVEGMVKCA
jgi:hypothetical protein